MLYDYLKRGLTAGAVGGLAYGLFVAFVGNRLVVLAETFEEGHAEAHAAAPVATDLLSVGGGVVFGLLLGTAVFGAAYYFLEPALPGAGDTKSYVLAGAGFLTVSGSPWVLLAPQPPGVSHALPTDTRLLWYGVMMVVGAVASGLAVAAYGRLARDLPTPLAALGALATLALIPAVALVAPANSVSGPAPAALVSAFRAVVAAGQLGLWLVMASTHAWLVRRDGREERAELTDDPASTPTAVSQSG